MGEPPLRVSLVGPVYPWRGGIAHYTACLARALQGAGHSVQVVNYRTLYIRWLFPGRTMLDESAAPFEFPQSPVLRPLAPWTWVRALHLIRSHRAQVVVIQWWHVFFAPCLLSVAWLCRWSGVPVSVLCHNVSDHDKHALLNLIANRLLTWSGATVVIQSERDAAAFRQRHPGARVFVTQHPSYDVFPDAASGGQREARARLGLREEGALVLFFGLVRPYKGLEDLLRAMTLVKGEAAPDLLIAGEFYEPVERYRDLVRELGLEGRVHIHDRYVPNEEVKDYFTAADVLVAPYRTATQSGVVRIATACAVPVIVSDAGGLPEMIEPEATGLVFPAGSAPCLARELERFFAHGFAERFRANLEEQRSRFSWQPLVEHVESVAGGK